MVLSNVAITDLNQFVLMAKREIGLVKPTDIINDQHYAFNLFITALFSEDDALVSVTRKLSADLGVGNGVIVAIEIFIKDLRKQNKPEKIIESNKSYLIKLANNIFNIAPNGTAYRRAVDAFLVDINQDEKTFCLNLARSFFAYWMSAMGCVVDTHDTQNKNIDSSSQSFIHLWSNLDEEFLSMLEEEKLNGYKKEMQDIGASVSEIEARIKIAKIIIVKFRKYNQTSEGYREVIDETVGLLTNTDMRDYFLVVSREFYRFCVN